MKLRSEERTRVSPVENRRIKLQGWNQKYPEMGGRSGWRNGHKTCVTEAKEGGATAEEKAGR